MSLRPNAYACKVNRRDNQSQWKCTCESKGRAPQAKPLNSKQPVAAERHSKQPPQPPHVAAERPSEQTAPVVRLVAPPKKRPDAHVFIEAWLKVVEGARYSSPILKGVSLTIKEQPPQRTKKKVVERDYFKGPESITMYKIGSLRRTNGDACDLGEFHKLVERANKWAHQHTFWELIDGDKIKTAVNAFTSFELFENELVDNREMIEMLAHEDGFASFLDALDVSSKLSEVYTISLMENVSDVPIQVLPTAVNKLKTRGFAGLFAQRRPPPTLGIATIGVKGGTAAGGMAAGKVRKTIYVVRAKQQSLWSWWTLLNKNERLLTVKYRDGLASLLALHDARHQIKSYIKAKDSRDRQIESLQKGLVSLKPLFAPPAKPNKNGQQGGTLWSSAVNTVQSVLPKGIKIYATQRYLDESAKWRTTGMIPHPFNGVSRACTANVVVQGTVQGTNGVAKTFSKPLAWDLLADVLIETNYFTGEKLRRHLNDAYTAFKYIKENPVWAPLPSEMKAMNDAWVGSEEGVAVVPLWYKGWMEDISAYEQESFKSLCTIWDDSLSPWPFPPDITPPWHNATTEPLFWSLILDLAEAFSGEGIRKVTKGTHVRGGVLLATTNDMTKKVQTRQEFLALRLAARRTIVSGD